MNKGRNATTLRKDIDEKKPAMLAQVNTLLPNSSMWMIGSLTLFSTITNRTAQTKNIANNPTTIGESQAYFWPPKVSARSSGTQDATISTAPR